MEKGAQNPELQEMLNIIDLPAGFTFLDLFQLLDSDGDNCLSKYEFVCGVMRLIYNTDFHRDCMVSCALGQIKQLSKSCTNQCINLQSEMQAATEEVRKDIQAVH